jgi:alpha-galactosidase
MQILSDHVLADTCVRYLIDPASGQVGLQLHPAALSSQLAERRAFVFEAAWPDGYNPPALVVDSLAQIKIAGDPAPGTFASGHTMRQSASCLRFRFEKQDVAAGDGITTIRTTLRSSEGLVLEHSLSWRQGDAAFEITTRFINGSSAPVVLEMLGSFSLSGITPFAADDAPGRLVAHRFRSVWSAEGRLETRALEDLHLERSWSGAGAFGERFGQVGSMPVRKWFPFVAVEDVEVGVVWGAQLAWAGSWQMEIFRQHDDVCLSGGLADREFGHWKKTIHPGETLEAPPATVACVQGTLDDLCDRLTALQHRAADTHPAIEADLPIVFNEWCTTWGHPAHDTITAIADRLQGSDVRFLVIDAGWFKTEGTTWYVSHGDWNPSAALFPEGIEATAAAIRARGLIPGLWFEMETCGETSAAFSLVDHLLKKDGVPVTSNSRRFWDLNDPWVIDYLTEKVIGLLRRGGFGYLKVDYNETIGLGSDHADSLGEGLRLQTLGTHRFFEKIRASLPDLVIENCASGGHRLEPSMLARSAMSSFSDAHETVEIPIIAASLHRLMLPRQSQIWAVLKAADSDQRLLYSLAATFLGRMCLSGEITDLSPAQWQLVQNATQLYRQAAAVIKSGASRHFGEAGPSWRHPRGWRAVRRLSSDGRSILLVIHTFAGAPVSVTVPLPEGDWEAAGSLPGMDVSLAGDAAHFHGLRDFQGGVLLLRPAGPEKGD